MKNKKGFTLIELLAVIVILAIIALIAVPQVLKILNKARLSAAEDSVYGIVKASESYIIGFMLKNNGNIPSEDLIFNCESEGCKLENTLEGYNLTNLDVLDFKGTTPSSGKITVKNGGKEIIAEDLKINGFTCTYENEKASCSKSGNTNTTTTTTTTVLPTKLTKGTAVYLNPETKTLCEEKDVVSTTGTKIGCMKWYVYKDNGNGTYQLILDHNTTATVVWNSTRSNTSMGEVAKALTKDTETWDSSLNARLITADEIAEITGANLDTTIKWSSSKTYGESDIETQSGWFYFDGTGTTYSGTDGWRKIVATTQGASKYAWLYDNTNGCTSYGCNIDDSSNYGYWTSTPVVGDSYIVWSVYRGGNLSRSSVGNVGFYGVRPVITISKSIIS